MLKLTSQIVTAYLKANPVDVAELPSLVTFIHRALIEVTTPVAAKADVLVPFVPVKKSVKPDAIVCLVCGRESSMLKRHLATAHGLTTKEYHGAFGLPADYPMVAPNYAEKRSALALASGLGRKRTAKPSTRAKKAK